MKQRSPIMTMVYFVFAPVFLILPLVVAQIISEVTTLPYPVCVFIVVVGGFVACCKRHKIKQALKGKFQ